PELRAEALLSRLETAERNELPSLLSLFPPLTQREAIQRVAGYLRNEQSEVHAAAAEALSRADADTVIEVLEELRQDSRARLGVALAYGRLGSDRCTPLLEMLRDPDPRVRAAAAEGSGRCGLATVPELSAALHRESDPAVARALVRSLGNEGGSAAV